MTPRTRKHIRYALVITAMTLLAQYFMIMPVFRGRLQTYLGIGDNRFGLLFSLLSVVGIPGVLFGGVLIDRIGARRGIRLGLLGIGSAMLVLACAGTHYALFALATALAGLFQKPLVVAINIYLGKLFPRHQRRILSLNLASTSVGGMLYPLAAEGLLLLSLHRNTVDFAHVLHVPFLVAGLLLLAGSLVYRKRRVRQSPAATRAPASVCPSWSWRDLMLPRQSWLLALLIAMHGAVDGTLHIWMARFLESESFAGTPLAPGIVLSGFAVAYILSRILLATLPDHIGRHLFLVIPGLAGGSVMILAILSRSYMLTAAGYVLGAFLWSAEFPAFVSTALRRESKRFGAIMAVSGAVSGLAMFLLLNGVGMLTETLGEASMWLIMLIPACGFVLVGLGGACWVRKYGDQNSQHATIGIPQPSIPSKPRRPRP